MGHCTDFQSWHYVHQPFVRSKQAVCSDEGLMLEMSPLKLFTAANLPYQPVDNSKLPLKKSLFSHKKLNFRPLSFMCQCSAAVLRELDNKFGKYMNINLCMRSDKCLACY